MAALIFSPIVGVILEKWGRKNCIMVGFVVVVTATMFLALTQFIEDDNMFLILSIVARFIQGMGDMWVQTSCKDLYAYLFNRLLPHDM